MANVGSSIFGVWPISQCLYACRVTGTQGIGPKCRLKFINLLNKLEQRLTRWWSKNVSKPAKTIQTGKQIQWSSGRNSKSKRKAKGQNTGKVGRNKEQGNEVHCKKQCSGREQRQSTVLNSSGLIGEMVKVVWMDGAVRWLDNGGKVWGHLVES